MQVTMYTHVYHMLTLNLSFHQEQNNHAQVECFTTYSHHLIGQGLCNNVIRVFLNSFDRAT